MSAATLLRVLDAIVEVGPTVVGLVKRLAGRSTAERERENRAMRARAIAEARRRRHP